MRSARREGTGPPGAGEGVSEGGAVEVLRDGGVPGWLRFAASLGWRVLVVAAVVVVAAYIVARLRVVFIPLALALLITAVLGPPAAWLMDHRWPPILATWLVVLVAGSLLAGIGWLLVPELAEGLSDVGSSLGEAYDDVTEWLVEGPLGVAPDTIEELEESFAARLQRLVETGFTTQAALVVEIVTAFLLTLVVSFFYIKDGGAFRAAVLDRLPVDTRRRAGDAMSKAMWVLRRYLLGTVVVGLVDAVLIGIGVAIIGVPLVLPIMVFTFFAAFFPMVGAIIAGAVATLLALASGGAGDALLVMALTIAVQQIDGDVVAPLVYSRAVRLHPLAILLALTIGAVVAGIMGAFLAVPLLAVTLAMRSAWIDASPDDSPD